MVKRLWLTLAGAYALPVTLALYVAWLILFLWVKSSRYVTTHNVFAPVLYVTSENALFVILIGVPLLGLVLLVARLFRPVRVLAKIISIGMFGAILLVALYSFTGAFFGVHRIENTVTVGHHQYTLISRPIAGGQYYPECLPPHLTIFECSGLGVCTQYWQVPEDEAMYGHFSANQFALSYDAAQSTLIIDTDGYYGFTIPISEQRN